VKAKGRRGRGEASTSARRVEAAHRQAQAVRLRIEGYTLAEIACELGYSDASGALKAIRTALEKTLGEPCEDLRGIHRERLGAILRNLWPELGEASEGLPPLKCPACGEDLPADAMQKAMSLWFDRKHEAIDRILKVLKREADLEGLDRSRTEAEASKPISVVIDWTEHNPQGGDRNAAGE